MKEILPDVIQNDTSVLIKSSVDFYSPSKKLAIDISEKNTQKNRYSNKMKALAFHGIDYIMFFPTEPRRKETMMSYILNRIESNMFHADYIISEISESEYRKFAKENSFKTLGRPSINYGFFVGGNLHYTLSIRRHKSNYEIVNFVRKNGQSSDQAFTRLFEYFKKIHTPKIITYLIDRRIERYDYLLKLGFYIVGFGNPRWYLVIDDRIKRDTNKYTGDKVWDCGTIKLMWKSQSS
jgi:hypothetical protein